MLRVNRYYQFIFILILTCVIVGCQPTTSPIIEGEAIPSSTASPRPALEIRTTNTPNAITDPTQPPNQPPDQISTQPPTATPLILPTFPTLAQPQASLPNNFETIVGYSAQGNPITARRFGTGPRIILLVGGIHGGWEANTVTLIEELTAHFDSTPADLLPEVSLILIRAANPDGLPHGRTPAGRFNANEVDLNRNWGCGWSPDAVWRNAPVNAGTHAFSEPETQALSAYITAIRPSIALFYHSAAGGVFSGACNDSTHSQQMAAILGEATGYSYGQPFSAYPVTGTAAAWVDSLGIPSADVELFTSNESEFNRNLRGIMALQHWIVNAP